MLIKKANTHTRSLSIHKSTDTHCHTYTLHYLHIRPHPSLPFECMNYICPLSLTEDKLCFRAVFPPPVLMECQSVHLMLDQYSYSPLPPLPNNSDLCPYKDICYVVSDSHFCVISAIKQTVIRTVTEKWKMTQCPHLRHTASFGNICLSNLWLLIHSLSICSYSPQYLEMHLLPHVTMAFERGHQMYLDEFVLMRSRKG